MSKMKVNRIENTSTTAGGIDINTSGNVGIGTSSPSDTLHLNDSVGYGLKITDSSSHIAVYRTHIDGAILKTASNHPLLFGTNDTERMRIDSSGNVLLGKTTTSITTVGNRLSAGLISISASSTSTNLAVNAGGSLSLCNTNATDNNFSNIGGYNSNGLVVSQIDFVNVSHAGRTGDIAFLTHNGTSMSERMRIDSAGRVGINTSAPQRDLHIHNASSSTNTYLQLTSATTGTSSTDGFQLWAYGSGGSSNAAIVQRENAALEVWTNNTERMRINSNGRVDIGDQLGVAHAGEFQVINTSGGQQDNDALAFFETNSPDWIMMTNYNAGGTHYHMRFTQQGSVRGSISGSSGAGVTYGGSSDYRLKENVVEITGTQGIDICKKLKPSYFNWINNRVETGETNTVDGFIAHEVQEAGVLAAVIGEKDAVNEDGSIDAQIMDYGKMTPVLSAAIKGLIDKIETLEQRLTDAGL